MANRIRIIQYRCWNNHNSIAAWHTNCVCSPKLAEVCALCEICGSCAMVVPRNELTKIKPIAEFKSPCEGTLLCQKSDYCYDDSVVVTVNEEFSWAVSRLDTAVLIWRDIAVYSIRTYDRLAPQEVKAARAAMMIA